MIARFLKLSAPQIEHRKKLLILTLLVFVALC